MPTPKPKKDRPKASDLSEQRKILFAEKFVELNDPIAAMIQAYPRKNSWKDSSKRVGAAKLFKDPIVLRELDRIRELRRSRVIEIRDKMIRRLETIADGTATRTMVTKDGESVKVEPTHSVQIAAMKQLNSFLTESEQSAEVAQKIRTATSQHQNGVIPEEDALEIGRSVIAAAIKSAQEQEKP